MIILVVNSTVVKKFPISLQREGTQTERLDLFLVLVFIQYVLYVRLREGRSGRHGDTPYLSYHALARTTLPLH
jgi:hypothetical protein